MISSSSGFTLPSKRVDEKDGVAVPNASHSMRCTVSNIKAKKKSHHLLHDVLVRPLNRLQHKLAVFLCILQEARTRKPFWEISYYKSLEYTFAIMASMLNLTGRDKIHQERARSCKPRIHGHESLR